SRLFRVEAVQLRFANGTERTYERLVGRGTGYGAVMLVAMLDAEHAVLVEEYCGGTDEYELSLPKRLIGADEDVLAAAKSERKEEAAVVARQLEALADPPLSAGCMAQPTQVVFAGMRNLERPQGRRPEPMRDARVALRARSAVGQRPPFTQ